MVLVKFLHLFRRLEGTVCQVSFVGFSFRASSLVFFGIFGLGILWILHLGVSQSPADLAENPFTFVDDFLSMLTFDNRCLEGLVNWDFETNFGISLSESYGYASILTSFPICI